jgi:hypothetical protein
MIQRDPKTGKMISIELTKKGKRTLELAEKREAGTITDDESMELYVLLHGRVS